MSAIKQLPRRPLTRGEIGELASDDRLKVAPYGGMQEASEFRVYALKLTTGARAYAFGYDSEDWHQLATVKTTDLVNADEQLDSTLDGWVLERYGDRFEVLKLTGPA